MSLAKARLPYKQIQEIIAKLREMSMEQHESITHVIISQNIASLTEVSEIIEKARTSVFSADYQEFVQEREELLNMYAVKDGEGNIVVDEDGGVFFPDTFKKDEFESNLATLEEANIEIIQEMQKKEQDYAKFLEKEAEITIFQVPFTAIENVQFFKDDYEFIVSFFCSTTVEQLLEMYE